VLVADVADDLLDDVLERHEPHHLAVLVDDEGEMRLAREEGLELVGQAACSPARTRRASAMVATSSLAGVAAGGRESAQEVLGVQDADDVLGLVAPERHAGIGRCQHLAHDRLGRLADSIVRILVRWTITSATVEMLQVEQAADHVAVGLLDRNLPCASDRPAPRRSPRSPDEALAVASSRNAAVPPCATHGIVEGGPNRASKGVAAGRTSFECSPLGPAIAMVRGSTSASRPRSGRNRDRKAAAP
jgi:hypothetical protein